MRGDVKGGDKLLLHTYDSSDPLCGVIATVDYTIRDYGKIICAVPGRQDRIVLYYDEEDYYWQQMSDAQADRNPEGEKPQALSAKHESPVGEADAPKTCPGE